MDIGLLVLGIVVIFILVLIILAVKGGKKEQKPEVIPVDDFPQRRTLSPKKTRIKARKDFSGGYDPLDDSLLVEPVDLTITHPEKGKMTLKVNRWNAEKYLEHGPSAFPKRRQNSYSSSEKRYYASSGEGFDLLDWVIFYHIFLAPNHGHFYEPSAVDARGVFGGEDYISKEPISEPTVPEDSKLIHDDQSPHERLVDEGTPVIIDPFPEEKTSIPSDDEASNAFGGSEDHSSREEVTSSGIPSDDESPNLSGGGESDFSHDESVDSSIPSDDGASFSSDSTSY